MRSSTPLWLVVIAAITILAVWMILPNNPGLFGRPIEARPGLDIQGGLRVLLAADAGVEVNADSIDKAKQIVENRVNALGVSEPVVQTSGSNRILVELPGIRDPKQAIDLIKQTGLLEFVDFSKTGSCTAAMPTAGQFIYTSAQQQLRGGAPAPGVTPTTTGTVQPTPAATTSAVVTVQATGTGTTVTVTLAPTVVPTTAPTLAATTVATSAATAAATKVSANTNADVSFKPNYAQATDQATAQATTAATTQAVATAGGTTQATAQATAQGTSAATAQATGAATAAATTLPIDGSSKERALSNPCSPGQPFATIMTGGGLQDATPQIGGNAQNQWVVSFTLRDNEEGRKFGPFTATHIQQPMAIVLDGQVLSAPVIQSRLDTGGQITGNFTQQQAKDLGLQLRYGALPVPLHVESTEQVGASLGAESVAATGRAGILGVLVVLIYMIVVYRIPGVMAALALLLFAAINFALYKFIPVTLTLPAITGFLISIGTAVDGNILIFERIKEELRYGRPLDKAIEVGFTRAWPSIRDSNISTLMIGLILYFFGGQFGAGAVRGFAVTLMLGLLTNLFTAVIVTRTLLNVVLVVAGDALRRNKWMIGL